jgi:hypothetical protein
VVKDSKVQVGTDSYKYVKKTVQLVQILFSNLFRENVFRVQIDAWIDLGLLRMFVASNLFESDEEADGAPEFLSNENNFIARNAKFLHIFFKSTRRSCGCN